MSVRDRSTPRIAPGSPAREVASELIERRAYLVDFWANFAVNLLVRVGGEVLDLSQGSG